MEKSEELILPKGALKYRLTNDFMFKAFLQRNKKALRGLLCALLQLKPEDIKSVTITNPIEEGAAVNDKTLILDIKLILNHDRIINIEMQVENLGNWEERSLTYLCRSFDQLNAGEDYKKVLKTIHVGILDFTPAGFPEKLFMQYYLYNVETKHIYSDKLRILMLQLNQLGNPDDEKRFPDLYYWAQLFRATTWEEIEMLAEKNEAIRDGIVTLKQLSEDEKIQMQCEAREQLRRDFASATQLGEERGEERGKKIGRIEGAIAIMLKLGLAQNEIIQAIKEQFELTDEQANNCLVDVKSVNL